MSIFRSARQHNLSWRIQIWDKWWLFEANTW